MTEEINLDENNLVKLGDGIKEHTFEINNNNISETINLKLNKKSSEIDITLFNYLYKNAYCNFNNVNDGLYTFSTSLDNNNTLTLTIQDLLSQGQFSSVEYVNRLIGLSDGINYITILSIKNSNSENPYIINI